MVSRIQSVMRIGAGVLAVCVLPIFWVSQLATLTTAHGENEPLLTADASRPDAHGWERPSPGMNVRGSAACKECHFHELVGKAWSASTHSASFQTRYKTAEAKSILKKLKAADVTGVARSMKSSDRCIQCHFSGTVSGAGKFSAKEGISCESCHGAAEKWFERHNDFGAGTAAEETPAHRQKRIADSVAGGMIRPDAIYLLTRNCLSCHVVDDEALVNIGGHSSGSEFEVVAWSQGEVRHNFSIVEGGVKSTGPVNKEASKETRRVMYVVGWAVDLSRSLQNLAKAKTKDGAYAKDMKSRIKKALGKLGELQASAPEAGADLFLSQKNRFR